MILNLKKPSHLKDLTLNLLLTIGDLFAITQRTFQHWITTTQLKRIENCFVSNAVVIIIKRKPNLLPHTSSTTRPGKSQKET